MKNNFFNFSATVKDAFENDETKYVGFSQLLKDSAKGVYEAGITKADADKQIRDTFRVIMGVDEKASAKEIRKAIRRNKNEIFEVIEDTIEDLLTSGWQENEFFKEYVETKNLALGDENEFYVDDVSVLTVSEVSGNHHNLNYNRVRIA